jgi:hypothetical protein
MRVVILLMLVACFNVTGITETFAAGPKIHICATHAPKPSACGTNVHGKTVCKYDWFLCVWYRVWDKNGNPLLPQDPTQCTVIDVISSGVKMVDGKTKRLAYGTCNDF